jgi:hypothetical protein
MVATTAKLSFGQVASAPLMTIQRMIEKEHEASLHKPPFSYISVERSDRTGGHEWTEQVIEVPDGRLRELIMEDGISLSGDRRRREGARLRSIAQNPESFIRHERERKTDEQRAQEILEILPRAFLFEDDGLQQGWKKISYRPNPSYVPQSYEERILHEMSGVLLIDPHTDRLHMLEGSLAQDVSFGYGLIATLHRGSTFSIVRSPILEDQWKTTQIDVHMDGHVVLFKAISRQQSSIHKDFKLLPYKLTIAQAVALLVQ